MDLTKQKMFHVNEMIAFANGYLPETDTKKNIIEAIELQRPVDLKDTEEGFCCSRCGMVIFEHGKADDPSEWTAHCGWCGQKYHFKRGSRFVY